MAVVALFVLMAALVIPNLSSTGARELRDQAGIVVAQLELARQRSVVTGVPHRLLIDLDASAHRIEWLGNSEETEEEALPAVPADYAFEATGAPLDLSPPREEVQEFQPMPGKFGDLHRLADEVVFAGVETPEGWTDRGEAFVVFEYDGSTAYTAIVLEGPGGASLTLDVLPLADVVQIRDETP